MDTRNDLKISTGGPGVLAALPVPPLGVVAEPDMERLPVGGVVTMVEADDIRSETADMRSEAAADTDEASAGVDARVTPYSLFSRRGNGLDVGPPAPGASR